MYVWQAERALYHTPDGTWWNLIENCLQSLTNLSAKYNTPSYTVKEHVKMHI